jgi:hypothetical protein
LKEHCLTSKTRHKAVSNKEHMPVNIVWHVLFIQVKGN